MIQAALSEVSRKRLVAVSSRVLGPSIKGCPGTTMKRHNARLSCPVLLIRIYPADTIDLALLVMHSLDECPYSIARKG